MPAHSSHNSGFSHLPRFSKVLTAQCALAFSWFLFRHALAVAHCAILEERLQDFPAL